MARTFTPAAIDWSAPWRRAARQRLLAWYRRNARDLPWRRTHDPYAVWVSEIMLQQTQVATVERYFSRFLQAFPTIAALADAKEDAVLRLWEGLGYYRRARQLHAAAKEIVAEHGGQFPRELETVRGLPGIGRYTAGAILSIAHDDRLPILEANTVRLLSRLLAYREDVTTARAQQLLWQAAEAILPNRGSGTLNQALMELGSLICTPRNPNCDGCPMEALCPTRRGNLQDVVPLARRQEKTEDRHEAAVVIEHHGKILLRKCGDGERWAGLWDFPRCVLNAKQPMQRNRGSLQRQLIGGVKELTGLTIADLQRFATLRHGVTRFRITLDGFAARSAHRTKAKGASAKLRWVRPDDIDEYPLNTTGRKLAKLWQEEFCS